MRKRRLNHREKAARHRAQGQDLEAQARAASPREARRLRQEAAEHFRAADQHAARYRAIERDRLRRRKREG